MNTQAFTLQSLNDYLIWSDRKFILLLKQLSDEEFHRSFGELAGSIHSKTAHILSIYEFFIKILEKEPDNQYPDLSGLSRRELIEKWEDVARFWLALFEQSSGLHAIPLAGNRRVEKKHILLDVMLHTVHHRGQILTMIRLLGKDSEEIPTESMNMDYLHYLFHTQPGQIHPALNI